MKPMPTTPNRPARHWSSSLRRRCPARSRLACVLRSRLMKRHHSWTFVLDTLERTKAAVSRLKLQADRYLACAPSSALAFFRILEERRQGLLEQEGEDLGARMHRACETLFQRNYQQVLIVGTDVPSLPLDYYRQALDQLEPPRCGRRPGLRRRLLHDWTQENRAGTVSGHPWSTDRAPQ